MNTVIWLIKNSKFYEMAIVSIQPLNTALKKILISIKKKIIRNRAFYSLIYSMTLLFVHICYLFKIQQLRFFMISGHLIQLLCDFRRTQVDPKFLFSHPFSLNDKVYNTFLSQLLQIAQRMNLQNTTKFLAKKYLDIFLSAHQNNPEQLLRLVALTCLRTATKFNQVSNVSDIFTIPLCMELSGGAYTTKQFIDYENKLIDILGFKFRFTTPYDFIVVHNLMPNDKKVITLVESVIDFTISISQIRNFGAEQIFFGSLLYCCKEKSANNICFQIIRATTFKWEQSNQIAILIQHKIKQICGQ